MKISYCTSIKNRLDHFIKASAESFKSLNFINKKFKWEWCICDYDSDDNLQEYIHSLQNDNIKYKKVIYRKYFHHSRAKNIAHKMADGDILINLDADNIITVHYHREVYKLFEQGAQVVWPTINRWSIGGGIGRIAIDKKTFYDIRGYDENIKGWGGEDLDIIDRCHKLNLNVKKIRGSVVRFLMHSDEYRTANLFQKNIKESAEINKKYVYKKIENNELIANKDKTWGI